MSTKRRTLRRPRGGKGRITPEADAAWQACDEQALSYALGLKVWEPSPLPREVTSLGVSQDAPPESMHEHRRNDYRKAQELQRMLWRAAGWPNCRQAYAKNLREAKVWARYCAELVKYPNRGGYGTNCDPISRRRALEEARSEVAHRKRLLAGLEDLRKESLADLRAWIDL